MITNEEYFLERGLMFGFLNLLYSNSKCYLMEILEFSLELRGFAGLENDFPPS
jgi:hypothetical protein